MDGVALLKLQLNQAHQWLEGTLGELTAEQCQFVPPGRANPPGVCYAHAVLSEDMVVNGMLRGGTPLFAADWADRTGLSEPMPLPGPDWPRYFDWTRSVRIDLPALRRYAQAVYGETERYLAGLQPADLDSEFDLSAVGFGSQPVGWVISTLLIGHLHDEAGELSAVKGVQGLSGYPEG